MWSKEKIEERSKVLFNSPYVSSEVNERNQKEWAKAVISMGDKFAFAVLVQRKGK